MRIDRRLHLVIPIYAEPEEGGDLAAYVHSTPLAEEVVDVYFDVLGRTCTAIFAQGFGMVSGQGHAMRILRKVAIDADAWFNDPKSGRVGVERGLVEEIRRLTMVAASVKEGQAACSACASLPKPDEACPQCHGTGAVDRFRWDSLPLQVAVDRGVLSTADRKEVENAIVFFIAAYATLARAQRRPILEAAAELWGAQLTSSHFTEWTASLRTSMPGANTGANAPAAASAAPAPANATAGGRPRSVPV
jgi:RNA polymerase subunit RPABC4/transcription elongation factor Spt4